MLPDTYYDKKYMDGVQNAQEAPSFPCRIGGGNRFTKAIFLVFRNKAQMKTTRVQRDTPPKVQLEGRGENPDLVSSLDSKGTAAKRRIRTGRMMGNIPNTIDDLHPQTVSRQPRGSDSTSVNTDGSIIQIEYVTIIILLFPFRAYGTGGRHVVNVINAGGLLFL